MKGISHDPFLIKVYSLTLCTKGILPDPLTYYVAIVQYVLDMGGSTQVYPTLLLTHIQEVYWHVFGMQFFQVAL